MSDFIKRTDATEAVWRILNGMGYSQKHNDRLVEEVDAVLDEYPAADVRPVVMCRDCKHNNACLTQAFVEEESKAPFDRNTFFCADGERGSYA